MRILSVQAALDAAARRGRERPSRRCDPPTNNTIIYTCTRFIYPVFHTYLVPGNSYSCPYGTWYVLLVCIIIQYDKL